MPKLVAICDTDPEILARRKAEWDVELATTEPEELCRREDVDAVVIATPNDTHRPIAVAAAQGRQARHVREAARAECRRGSPDVRGRP